MARSESPAEKASINALMQMKICLENNEHFVLEAGAGAGKTYSLIKALNYLVEKRGIDLARNRQRIACITYTNVAKDEIIARTDKNPIIFCETNHVFCWHLISRFQKQLRTYVAELPEWEKILSDEPLKGDERVDYVLGHRSNKNDVISLHHDDILKLVIRLMEHEKFRFLLKSEFPYILIDEYQDTEKEWIKTIESHFLRFEKKPLFGFFGDHWQKIYGDGCGKIDNEKVVVIEKKANFRSAAGIVNCLNRMRPELPQEVKDPDNIGEVIVYHTNNWNVERQGGSHWKGDLPQDLSRSALNLVQQELSDKGWEISSSDTKILMLTHRLLASEQGYSSLTKVFKYTDSYIKLENRTMKFFVEVLEPVCEEFQNKQYGKMFALLGRGKPAVSSHTDKQLWSQGLEKIIELRNSSTVGDVLDYIVKTERPRLPDAILSQVRKLQDYIDNDKEDPSRDIVELMNLRKVDYREVISFYK